MLVVSSGLYIFFLAYIVKAAAPVPLYDVTVLE